MTVAFSRKEFEILAGSAWDIYLHTSLVKLADLNADLNAKADIVPQSLTPGNMILKF